MRPSCSDLASRSTSPAGIACCCDCPAGSAPYFLGETEDVEFALYAFAGEGEQLAQAAGLAAAFSQDGETLVYLLSDDKGRGTLFGHPLGWPIRSRSSTVRTWPSRGRRPPSIPWRSSRSRTKSPYSADIGGRDLVELISHTTLARPEGLFMPGEPWLYLLLTDLRGDLALYFTPLGRADGRMLLEELRRAASAPPIASSLGLAAGGPPGSHR